jgi:DNA-binding transcriptional LysR family regulator
MAVNHQHLRAFHAVAIECSISRAARRLNVSQPTLSQQLKALEDRHQATLFDGRRPPLRLTAMGRELFALTQKLFATSTDIDEFLGDEVGHVPSVRLSSDSPIYAARMAARLRAHFGEANIQARIGNARETLSWLNDAQVDAAIVSDPPGDNHYTYEPLFADRFMVAMPVDHPMAGQPNFPITALTGATLLVRNVGSRTRQTTERMLTSADITPGDIMELHTRETIREGVALGLGVSLFISSECPPDPRIVYAPLEPSGAGLAGYVVCLTERRRTRLMRVIMSLAAELRALSPVAIDAARAHEPSAAADCAAARQSR